MKKVIRASSVVMLVVGLLLGCMISQSGSLYEGKAVGGSQESDAEPLRITDGLDEIEPQADRILREMSDYLKAHREYIFHAEISYDSLLSNDQMIQYGGSVDVSVQRPNKLHAEYRGDERKNRVVFDGSTITLCDLVANVYSVMKVPPKIDAAVDHVFEKYGFSAPVADMVYSNPYRILTENVRAGFLVGRHAVDGIPCHHLAFLQEYIDWEIWIEDGPQPVPRKLVIRYLDEEGQPQYSARFTRWDFQLHHSEHYFHFHPPAGADEIDVLPAGQ
jgi:hypothetical protein